MNNNNQSIVTIARVLVAATLWCVAQPVYSPLSAQQPEKIALDSVSQHLRSNPKPKKAAAQTSMASAKGTTARAKRAVPSVVVPGTQGQSTTLIKSETAPAVRRSPAKAKTAAKR